MWGTMGHGLSQLGLFPYTYNSHTFVVGSEVWVALCGIMIVYISRMRTVVGTDGSRIKWEMFLE